MAFAGDHAWSSHAANAGGCDAFGLVPHPAYTALGMDPASRAAAYRRLFDAPLPEADLAEIRTYLQQQRALGPTTFQRRVEQETRRYAAVRPAHRPGKAL